MSVGAEQRDVTASNAANGVATEYVVVYADGVSLQAARAAVTALGATIVKENVAVGVATVKTSNPNFLRAVGSQRALAGAARNRIIGYVPPEARVDRFALEKSAQAAEGGATAADAATTAAAARAPQAEPLASLQWDMQMIHATPDGSYAKQRGDRRVLVGVIDTGIDASHPDIAPNFNRRLSRNFTIDIPEVDGPCEYAGCIDPPDVDNGGHGTHVAGTIAAAINGLGVAGVAPKVTLVNIRAGQDSGYFFPQPTVDALTYAGDAGIDVVNMSFFIDPWLYNCRNNPADSPEAQMEQRTIITATQRAVDYARRHGVTLVAAEGNEATDLGHPTTDTISPDYPPDTAYTRTVNNSCLVM
ncbi:MAG: S8 family serine peptidase, partial [Thermomicrobiaceae bacterium]|nr:S8 family serine peptidase [Thermomicrobiaceae bacterium]